MVIDNDQQVALFNILFQFSKNNIAQLFLQCIEVPVRNSISDIIWF